MKAFFVFVALPFWLANGFSLPVAGNITSVDRSQPPVSILGGLLSNVTQHTAAINVALSSHPTGADKNDLVQIVNSEITDITAAVQGAISALKRPHSPLNRRQDDPISDIIKISEEIVQELIKAIGPILETFGRDVIQALPVLAAAFVDLLPLLVQLGGDILQVLGPIFVSFLRLLLT